MPTADTLLVKQGRYALPPLADSSPANALFHRYPIIAMRYWVALGWLMNRYRAQFHPDNPHWPHNAIDPISLHYNKLLALSERPEADPQDALCHLGFSFLLGPSLGLRLDLQAEGESLAPMSMASWFFEALQGFARKLDALVQVDNQVELRQDLSLKALDEVLLSLTPLVARAIKSPHPFHDSDWLAVRDPGVKLSRQQLLDRGYRQRLCNQERDPTQRHKLAYYRLKWQAHGGELTFCRLRRKGETVPAEVFNASPVH
ncbi:hypothetical protein [Gallaecimonas xiamenensis]|uniref:Uncharacterized protein n=1 Tax=Gallaecimonas xiamenensis 3-C-1 TaxID=745411 RepID=K2K4G6_9GAMM|nr:hypothetical protein [Gallaecimonas xiamenensis]EKE72350.1 hypothetical protein B3C1_10977 [Gallaecimonas xiamenensis 3-C-1]